MSTKPRRDRPTMTPQEFLVWAEQQDEDYEFVNGEVVAMSRDRAGHNVTKRAAVRALEDAIRRAGLRCTPYSDGIAVETPSGVVRRPDASVDCTPFDPDRLVLDAPVIVVEVISPSSERQDTETKLADYFSIPSVAHYLIVLTDRRLVLHHARGRDDGPILTSIRSGGELTLDPPGIVVPVADFFPVELAPPEAEG
jgi:Uma2 family endonuclease